ncbi:Nuclear segregation protein BFR1 [Wickerhamomyces ciferrii]|uniref:Nuclear segregation protein BFR1 n=1 Tax=Wickerhamomyces ciferrii (strain ATCC 14091 / BCRC 22168 / CBS 111 / JCM 3599 / NBRC 0793 / NRRL Y-1031 F-60-10) TaxID=1206466 RepID=K0KDX0_WICCF|nr:Nuclear segregation protein BFR1 [Wickerhamomyces ciferrii]CCH41126.1 Nuclear segregation protein BFR1 [Wickerhamomyces ciferrii]
MSATTSPAPSFDSREPREPRVQKRFIKGPDNKARDEIINKLNKEIKAKDLTLNEIKAQISKTTTDPKINEERKNLIGELNELKKTQADFKGKRDLINSKIKEVDSQLKKKISEVQSVTSKHNYKSTNDIDNEIKKLEDQISSGDLKLVEERLAIKNITQLRKLRKDFNGIQSQQKLIDQDKEKISNLKKELSSLNSKEVSAKFESIQKQLDELSLSNKSVNDKRQSLYDQRNKLQKEKDVLYNSIRKTRSDYDDQYKKFKKALQDEKIRVATEEAKLKSEKDKAERSSTKAKILSEASKPAFTEEIKTVESLLTFFDPTFVKSKTNDALQSKTFITERKGRVIEQLDDDLIIKKEETPFFAGSNGSSKGKKGKKSAAAKKFTLEPTIITQLGDLEISLPTSQDDVSKTIESLKLKLDEYLKTQDEVTAKNIESAKLEISKLESKWSKQDAKEAELEAKKNAETNKENEDESKEDDVKEE